MDLSKVLSKIKGVVGLYINVQHPDRFLVGYPKPYDNGVILSLISPDGRGDGISYCAWKNIYCMEWESEYLNQYQKKKEKILDIEFDGSIPGHNAFLNFAQENHLLVQFANPDSQRNLFGFIQSYTEKEISVERVFLNGTAKKNIHLSRNKFTFMCMDSETEKDLMKRYLEVKKDDGSHI